ncbi:MAG TPA: NAD(P)-dependent oxidoreductase [Chitinophagales bacterium]|nr:NAD(P)-dependent oxidoreductase [Chitinophagales bacterium]
MKIGIIREGKIPPDSRVPLAPKQCRLLKEKYPEVEIKVQSSEIRCFSDREFREYGIPVVQDVSDCDILLGVKEVPLSQLIPNKTYLFFSHTIKKQPHNRKLLQEIIKKKIRLIDYECLTDEKGIRVIAFGRWAGIIGAHNGLYAWGRKTGKLSLKRVIAYKDFAELKEDYKRIIVPPLRIIITGDGRVASGAVEVMNLLRIKRVSPDDYLKHPFEGQAVYSQLSPKDIYTHTAGKPFELQDFFSHPQDYSCDFSKWYGSTDLMINAIYWDPRAPRYFSLEEMSRPDFKIKAIADISCDINGSVPATLRATTIAEPVMGYDPCTQKETLPFQPHTIDIMAIDNLPNELPRDASESFGEMMANVVIPELLKPRSEMIERATIAKDGALTKKFEYLRDYVEGESAV